MQSRLGLVALLTLLGLAVAACGGEETNKPEADNKNAAKGDQQAQVDLPPFPPAPRGAENPRLRVPGEVRSYEDFLEYVITDASAKWQVTFQEADVPYSDLDFKPYDRSVSAPCGDRDQESGPAYCRLNQTIYFPTNWVNPTTGKIMAEYGDFAMAIVAAHEVGHHVQEQLGILGRYPTRQTELQADCFAGVWGYSQYDNIEPGDVGEAMDISWVSGDLPGTRRNAMGAHGNPEERVTWFRTGYDSGSADECFTLTPVS
jgi:predicted metalloprotease